MTDRDVDTSVPAVVLKLYHGGLAVARTLGRLGVEVHGVAADRRPGTASRYLRAVHRWDLDAAPASASVERLLELGVTVGRRPLLIATEDVGAMLVADAADALGEVFRFPAQPAGLARRLSNKVGMSELCAAHGVATPAVAVPRTDEDVERFAVSTQFPIVVKQLDTARPTADPERRVVIAADEEELEREWRAASAGGDPNLLLQEYVPGGADSVWMFNGYFDGDSRCLLGVTGQKLRQYPPHTGFTSLGVCRDNETVRSTTCRFMAALGYRGVLDLGFRFDARDGRYKLLDVNPRVGSTFRLFVTPGGHDVVRALYLDLTGQAPAAGEGARDGRRWLIENLDLASSLSYRRRGELGLREWAGSFRGVEEAAWFARDDPAPFALMLRDSFRRARRRAS